MMEEETVVTPETTEEIVPDTTEETAPVEETPAA